MLALRLQYLRLSFAIQQAEIRQGMAASCTHHPGPVCIMIVRVLLARVISSARISAYTPCSTELTRTYMLQYCVSFATASHLQALRGNSLFGVTLVRCLLRTCALMRSRRCSELHGVDVAKCQACYWPAWVNMCMLAYSWSHGVKSASSFSFDRDHFRYQLRQVVLLLYAFARHSPMLLTISSKQLRTQCAVQCGNIVRSIHGVFCVEHLLAVWAS